MNISSLRDWATRGTHAPWIQRDGGSAEPMLKGLHRWLNIQNMFLYSKEKHWGYSRISSNVGLDQKALKKPLRPVTAWAGKMKSPLLTSDQPCSASQPPKRREELTVSPRETYN